MKVCSRCKEQKPLEDFHRKSAAHDGRQAYCKPCSLEIVRAYRPGNRDRLRGYDQNWLARNKPRKLAYMRERYIANREALLEKDRLHRQANADHYAAYERARTGTPKRKEQHKRSREKCRDKIISRQAERASLLRSLPTEPVDRLAIYARDGGRCHLCGGVVDRDKFHLDHLIPVAHGGGYLRSNLSVAHPSCNQSRGAGRKPAQLLLFG